MSEKKIVVNMGCGDNGIQEGVMPEGDWREFGVDLQECYNPDFLGSMTDLPESWSEWADAVYASHALEHLTHWEVGVALKEWWRVLKWGGIIIILVPNLKAAAKLIYEKGPQAIAYLVNGHPVNALDMVYGHRINERQPGSAHRTGFTKKSLGQELEGSGFRQVKVHEQENQLVGFGTKEPYNGNRISD